MLLSFFLLKPPPIQELEENQGLLTGKLGEGAGGTWAFGLREACSVLKDSLGRQAGGGTQKREGNRKEKQEFAFFSLVLMIRLLAKSNLTNLIGFCHLRVLKILVPPTTLAVSLRGPNRLAPHQAALVA